ncbi:MAG: ATP-binding protein [Myxococcales bacterium]|nr:ATP-binding protein [Myxococcales bacterium]
MSGALTRLLTRLGRIRYRILAVNLLVLLVPVAGLEFARIYERQLLRALEQDMRNQAALVRHQLEADPSWLTPDGAARYGATLAAAARDTRTRIRVLDAEGQERVDSHDRGPPEGPEPPPPSLWPAARSAGNDVRRFWRADRRQMPIAERPEVRAALGGERSAHTRVGPKAVYLFVSEPVKREGRVEGAVYVIRSTRPVLVGLYRIRNGLLHVVAIAAALSVLLTAVLSWTISRPLSRLSESAKRIAAGERDVQIPTVARSGEIHDLQESLSVMTARLDARMRDMAEFAADVAHEFKSPLTSIRGAAELLGEGALEDPEARERFLRNIALDTERLDHLVTALLELGRIDAAETVMATFDLGALVRRAAARAETPEVRVEVRYDAPTQMVRGRERDLETALANLLDNAVRHAPEGSAVDLSVRGGSAGGSITLAVRDHGPGVPLPMRDKIFQRFFTTDDDQGTGLGLAIVTTVAAAHGGSACLVDAAGGGACFEMHLPIAA